MTNERQTLSSIGRQYGEGEGFGHADYNAARKAGYSNQEVKDWIHSDNYRLAEIKKNKGFYDQVNNNNVNASQAGKTTKNVDPDSMFDGDAYLAAHKDVANWWADASRAGIHSGSGTYSKAHGVNTDGWEQNWLNEMNKRYNTQYDDLAGFSQNQFARHHYAQHGINEGRQLRNPEKKKPEPKPQPQPKPTPMPQPVPDPPKPEPRPEYTEFIKDRPKKQTRYAGGRDFRQSLYNAKNSGKVDEFQRQAGREKGFNQQMSQFNNTESNNIYNKYANANRQAQYGRSDGSSIADKYIFKANKSNPIDIVALDKHIRRGPMYHEAKSEVAGLLTYGDKYRNSREDSSQWSQPNPMERVESPDFMSFYKQSKKDIDDIDI